MKPETEADRNTREGFDEDYRYFLFDIYCDRARNGELTLEQAMIEYMIEVTWVEHGSV